ncbi:MAG TPA: alkaline phosphatase family protein, partial [Candidatus Limnocylindrales bacterium]
AAQPLEWPNPPASQVAIADPAGIVHAYPLLKPSGTVVDGAVTQACGLATTRPGLACGDWAVNTLQPMWEPQGTFGAAEPPTDDRTVDLNIGDRMSDAGVSWAWYAGGWDNAAGNIGGPGWTNGFGPTCSDPHVSTTDGKTWPFCPDSSFQFHHQPFNYFLRYAPGTIDRVKHLKDEVAFLDAAKSGHLPQVSFVKPLGNENEHPGYSSEPNGSDHLVDLIQAIETGPQAKDTLIIVTYDEFGGAWDHVSPPGLGTTGAHDQFGPGTRVPALLIAKGFNRSGVDHTVYDTTSIMATIEHQFGLKPVAARGDVVPRDRFVNDLANAVDAGRKGH